MPRGTRHRGKPRPGFFLDPRNGACAMLMTSLSSDCGLVTHWTKEDIAYNAFRIAFLACICLVGLGLGQYPSEICQCRRPAFRAPHPFRKRLEYKRFLNRDRNINSTFQKPIQAV